jgi:hypothetical protein
MGLELYSFMPTGSCTVAFRCGYAPAFPSKLYYMTNRSPDCVLVPFFSCDWFTRSSCLTHPQPEMVLALVSPVEGRNSFHPPGAAVVQNYAGSARGTMVPPRGTNSCVAPLVVAPLTQST